MLLVVPLPVWIPFGLLLIVGTQASQSLEDAKRAILADAGITIVLLVLAAFGIWRFSERQSDRVTDWVWAALIGVLLAVPVTFILFVANRAMFW
jgi:cell division protein FtsW (lipid II flippase)